MCGIAGLLDTTHQLDEQELTATVLEMANALYHRGPDDGGTWADPRTGIALGHRRLSIVDVSPLGHQPMGSACGRYVVSFNGEIYNFQRLRRELQETCVFRGHSDTEVLLAAVSRYGVHEAVQRFNGMFAFALWDRETRRLHLVRDRAGEKPLYYGWLGGAFVFASELKAVRRHPGFSARLNRDAIALYLRHNYIPAPYTIYADVKKVQPGTIVTLTRAAGTWSTDTTPYWSAKQCAEAGLDDPFRGSIHEAVDALDDLLRDAVRMRMVADVPLGAFLSGGIDSSTIVALMQRHSRTPVRTFTIGFHEEGYNEAIHAKAVADHLGTDHVELYVRPEEALAVIPRLPALYDEPFSDSSQIPTYLLAALTRRHVTVSLSGDGGDELFGGYDRYVQGMKLWRLLGRCPSWLRRPGGTMLTALSPHTWDRLTQWIPNGSVPFLSKNPGYRLHKLGDLLSSADPEGMYRGLVSHWRQPARIVHGAVEPPTVLTDPARWLRADGLAERMMHLDLESYLPDDILVKVDRATMGVSLEARIPMLDHRVIEFAWRLPVAWKMQDGIGKWILKQVLYRYVPQPLLERPKMGFGVPLDLWLRGPLREWAESLLDERRLREDGIFDPAPIRQTWAEHVAGLQNWQYHLWDVLVLQSWLTETK